MHFWRAISAHVKLKLTYSITVCVATSDRKKSPLGQLGGLALLSIIF